MDVVIKRLLIDDMAVDGRMRPKVEKELNLLHQLSHPNIIKMLGASHVSSPPLVVYEDATNGNLGVFLARLSCNKKRMWRLLYPAALGLDYLHKKGVIHGDLELSNVLIGMDGQAKLSDFGLSALRSFSMVSSNRSMLGGLRWSAPECLKRRPTFASDVYSLAMCMVEAANGEPPFAFLCDDDARDNVRKGVVPHQPDNMYADAWELVVAMTNSDANLRPPLQQVIDKLQAFADAESAAEENYCSNCSSVVAVGSRFCSQCGTQVGADAPLDTAPDDSYSTESAGSTPSRAEPQETLEISDDEDAMSDDIPIPVFLDAIQRGNNADCEQALFRLLQLCTDEDPRKMLCDLNGVPVLVEAVKTCYSYFGQLCALKCLSWIAHLDCRCSRQEYEELKKSVRAVAPHELISLTSAVTDGTTEDKLRAVMCCACVASARESEQLDDFRIVELVIPLLRNANEAISAWAADALGNLSDRGVIADETIVSPLVEFLENGTNAQKTSAAFALGHLAGVNAFNCVTVMNCGGISSLGTLLETGTDTQKALAAFALGSLATSDDARVAIVGYLPDLVAFARAGTQIQREHAAFALGWLAHSDTICEMVITCGGITPLVDLVRSGTEDQKKQAALALGNVAVDSSENAATIFAIEGVFSALVELLQTGTDAQKENATRALSNLALNSQRGCAAITNEGAIPCLVELFHCGTRAQKGLAALTLGYLGVANKTNSTTIRNAGALELMVDLLRSEVDDHRQHAVTA